MRDRDLKRNPTSRGFGGALLLLRVFLGEVGFNQNRRHSEVCFLHLLCHPERSDWISPGESNRKSRDLEFQRLTAQRKGVEWEPVFL